MMTIHLLERGWPNGISPRSAGTKDGHRAASRRGFRGLWHNRMPPGSGRVEGARNETQGARIPSWIKDMQPTDTVVSMNSGSKTSTEKPKTD